MIRVLHVADVHLGFETAGRPTETGLNSRVHDVLDRLDEVVAFAAAETADLVCLAGDGATTSPSQAQFGAHDEAVPLAAVAHARFPYVALGHVHRHQGDLHAGGRPFVAYSGGLERIDFGEEDEAKGFYVVDLEGDGLARPPEFVTVAAR